MAVQFLPRERDQENISYNIVVQKRLYDILRIQEKR